jgi:hypothetical protein
MDQMGVYPPAYEIDATTNAAPDVCDGYDGIVDGVISDPDSCDFDPSTLLGTTSNCTTMSSEWVVSAEVI